MVSIYYNNINLTKRKIELDANYKQVSIKSRDASFPFRVESTFNDLVVKDLIIKIEYKSSLGLTGETVIDQNTIKEFNKYIEFYWEMPQEVADGIIDNTEAEVEFTISFSKLNESGVPVELFTTEKAEVRLIPYASAKEFIEQSYSFMELFKLTGGSGSGSGIDGADGFSPIATVSKVGDTTTISIQDKNSTTTATIKDGKDGVDGQDGFTPIVTPTVTGVTIQDEGGNTYAINNGTNGTNGVDGFSPIVTQVPGGVSIQDKTGNTYTITNGINGTNGVDGVDGFTPIIKAIADGIEIEAQDGTKYTITKGADGQNGAPGVNGVDGFSPIITSIPGGVTIQDKDGTVHTLTNGKDGAATHVELTKSDYEALSPVNPAVVYHITDEGYTMFNGVQYGGSGSGSGTAGYSPIANVSKVGDTATITITDQVGTTSVTVKDGVNGTNGIDGVDGFTPVITTVSNGVSIQDKDGVIHTVTNGRDGAKGADGADGTDGFTPVITQVPNGVSIQDENGNTYTITNGADGANGTNGVDGFTPIITPISNGVSIQDKTGNVYNITNGANGAPGANGVDGFSPVIKTVTNGVSIQDKDGTIHTVTNGVNGTNGTNGTNGAAATVKVGKVSTGTAASVKNTGTENAAVFDFVLPQVDTSAIVNTVINTIFPVGSYYFGKTKPSVGTWTKVTGGAFYAAGTTINGQTLSEGGTVPSAAPEIEGEVGTGGMGVLNGASGSFRITARSTPKEITVSGNSTNASLLQFYASDSSGVYDADATEITAKGVAITCWKRTA